MDSGGRRAGRACVPSTKTPTFGVSPELSGGDVLKSPLPEGFALPIAQLFAAD